jgi:hypothetical protein
MAGVRRAPEAGVSDRGGCGLLLILVAILMAIAAVIGRK